MPARKKARAAARKRKAAKKSPRQAARRIRGAELAALEDSWERPEPPPETVAESLTRIAQDAVIILRRELAAKAERALHRPGLMSMGDCIALLRLTAELGAAALQGSDEAQEASYERLTPEERVQLAALLLKVDYN